MTRKGRILLAILLVFVVIVAACAVTVAVLFSRTFEQLGLGDKPLVNGKSLADMQLEQYTPKQVYPLAKSLFRDNRSLVKYAPEASDLAAVDNAFEYTSIDFVWGVQYSNLIYRSASFAKSTQLVLSDKQLCALLNNVVKQAPDDVLLSTSAEILAYLGSKQIKDILDILQQYDVTIEQIRLLDKDGTSHMELLISLDISAYTQDASVAFAKKLNPRIYAYIDYRLDVSDTGIVNLSNPQLSVNGKDVEISQAVLDGLFVALDSSDISTKTVTQGISAFIAVVLEHVGRVGTETQYGMCGVNMAKRTIRFECDGLVIFD